MIEDKQQYINDLISEMMYQDEWLEYAEAMDIALRMYNDLVLNEVMEDLYNERKGDE